VKAILPPRRTVAIVLLALSLTAATPSGRPEDVGMSSERLQRINDVVKTYIDHGQISGAVTMVSRKGRIAHYEAQGLMDLEAKTPMRKDAIFRMASMSKPVTGVAILMLMEEGKLRLTDPVSRFIPEFKNPKVAMLKPAAGPTPPRPARSAPARARDLHRAGRARADDPRSDDAHQRP
jgi:Beta-lactamase class C and other penicillin binding proteins